MYIYFLYPGKNYTDLLEYKCLTSFEKAGMEEYLFACLASEQATDGAIRQAIGDPTQK